MYNNRILVQMEPKTEQTLSLLTDFSLALVYQGIRRSAEFWGAIPSFYSRSSPTHVNISSIWWQGFQLTRINSAHDCKVDEADRYQYRDRNRDRQEEFFKESIPGFYSRSSPTHRE